MTAKVLVMADSGASNGMTSEVINLLNPNSKCESFKNLPVRIRLATSGLLKNNQPIICGGQSTINLEYQDNCYTLGKNEVVSKLFSPRCCSASVVINNNILWVTGGFVKLPGSYSEISTNTTEFVLLDQTITMQGPELTGSHFSYHCMTKINEDLVLSIGGFTSQNRTLLIDVASDFTMKAGPNLNGGRYGHACGTFQLNKNNLVIVAGDDLYNDNEKSTEIWDPLSDMGWVKGNK